MSQQWNITKKECDVDSKGNYVVTKVVMELEKKKILGVDKKEFYDILIKLIGLVAIFIPVYLFFMARTAEIKKQKSIIQFEIYSNVAIELQKMLTKPVYDKEYQESKEKLFYELKPKVFLLNDTSIVKVYDRILININYHAAIYQRISYLDSLQKYYSIISDHENAWHLYSDSARQWVNGKLKKLLVDQMQLHSIGEDLVAFDIPLYVNNWTSTLNVKRADNNKILETLQDFRSELISLVFNSGIPPEEIRERIQNISRLNIRYILPVVIEEYPKVASANRMALSKLAKELNMLILASNSLMIPN